MTKKTSDCFAVLLAAALAVSAKSGMSTAEAIAAYEGTAEAACDPAEKEVEAPKDMKLGLDAKVPVIVGEIGRWARKDGDHAAKVNPAIHDCTNRVVNCVCVSSEGLKNQDQHHFDGPSVKALGSRYYEAWKGAAK